MAIESGQRRSARLMALKEQKNEKMVHAMDAFLHPPFDEHNSRKRGRKKNDTKEDYEVFFLLVYPEKNNNFLIHILATFEIEKKNKHVNEVAFILQEKFAQEADLSNNGNSSNSASAIQKQNDQIIEYILDMLEL